MTTCGHLSPPIPLYLFGFIRFYCHEGSSSLMTIWSFPYYLYLPLCPTLLFCLSQFITKLTSSIYLILLIINPYDLRRFIIQFSLKISYQQFQQTSKVFECILQNLNCQPIIIKLNQSLSHTKTFSLNFLSKIRSKQSLPTNKSPLQLMHTVHILVPFFKIDSADRILPESFKLLQLDPSSRAAQNIALHQIRQNQYAIQLADFDLNFLQINRLLETSQMNAARLQVLQAALKDYQYNPAVEENDKNENIGQLQKKLKKYQSLKQENKKLKKLLQVQLQNTQKVRQQTQKTMKVLRQQFDALVIEMSKKDKSSLDSVHGHNSSEVQPNQARQGRQKTTFAVSNAAKHTSIR